MLDLIFCQFKLMFFYNFSNLFLNQIFIYLSINKILVDKILKLSLTLLLGTNLYTCQSFNNQPKRAIASWIPRIASCNPYHFKTKLNSQKYPIVPFFLSSTSLVTLNLFGLLVRLLPFNDYCYNREELFDDNH